MSRNFDHFNDWTIANISDSHKSLLRVRGSGDLAHRIKALEAEWLELIEDATSFRADVKAMYKRQHLLIPVGFMRQYSKSAVMQHYDTKRFYLPYICFTENRKTLTQWTDVLSLLQQMRATMDETMLHMWVFKAGKDFYLRASGLANQIDNLTNYLNLNDEMLESTGLTAKMLPKAMLAVPNEHKLPGNRS